MVKKLRTVAVVTALTLGLCGAVPAMAKGGGHQNEQAPANPSDPGTKKPAKNAKTTGVKKPGAQKPAAGAQKPAAPVKH